MKTIIKIIIALLLITAMFNGGSAAMNNYSFEDAVHEALLFDPNASDTEVRTRVMKLAKEYGIPLEEDNIKINARGQDLIVTMTYTDTVTLVPGVFEREFTFSPQTSTRMLGKGGRRQ